MSRPLKAHCPECKVQAYFSRQPFRRGPHIAATILTGGLWAIGWYFAAKRERRYPLWRCSDCGYEMTVEDRQIKRESHRLE